MVDKLINQIFCLIILPIDYELPYQLICNTHNNTLNLIYVKDIKMVIENNLLFFVRNL
jgi:hypothetical protein